MGFGAKTLVTLRLAARRIPARGPVRARVSNANGFLVAGKLGGRKGRIRLKPKRFRVAAHANTTIKLKLPKALRRLLKRQHKLALRLTAKVTDPAGHTRTVNKRVAPRLKKERRR